MKLTLILKIVGTALLIMMLNIGLTILEVFIYSQIVPAKPRSFYDAHALESAPWVAGIGGLILMFIFTSWHIKKRANYHLFYALALPTAYTIIDVSVLLAMEVNFGEYYPIFILAALARYAGSLIAYFVSLRQKRKL